MSASFRTKKISLDSVSPRKRSGVVPKKNDDFGDGKISVRTMPGIANGSRRVPEEYRTLDRRKRHGWGFVFFLLILFLATVGGLYYMNMRPTAVVGESVSLAVSSPSEIVSGEEVTFTIEYENRDVVPLKRVELDVLWPDGFYYNSSTENPTSDRATTWMLGPLDASGSKRVEISGQLVGAKGDELALLFRLSYRPENINSDFEISKTATVLVRDARVDITLSAPEKLLAGQPATLVAELMNLTSEQLSGLIVDIAPPKDFEIKTSKPELQDGRWQGDIKAGDKKLFTVAARASDDAEGAQSWIVEVSEQSQDSVRRLLRKEFVTTPVKPQFAIELKVNGHNEDFEVEYGETLHYQAKIINKSSSALRDVKLTALLDSDVIDRSTIQTNGIAAGDTIVWTKEHIGELSEISSSGEVLISWTARLLPQGTVGRATVDNVVTVELDGLSGWQHNSPVFIISVGTGLVFNQGLYWDLGGQQVGKGNLPPVTNESTQYLAVWSIDSGSQEYESVTVSTQLPPKVSFVETEEVDEGALKYDEETSRLEWQINNFSTKLLPLKATFYLKLVPGDEDRGAVMTVLNPSTVVASGPEVFQSKSFSLTTGHVIAKDRPGDLEGAETDLGTVIE